MPAVAAVELDHLAKQGDLIAALEPVILRAAHTAANATLDDLGQAAIVSDIASMRHETLDGRLFGS